MRSLHDLEFELKKVGLHNQFWCKPEIKELLHILTDEEVITKAVNGRYKGGFALLVTTNHRLLLIDKKLWFMSLEDTRFDMITEVDYAARVFDATMSVRTVNKTFQFTSIHHGQLRDLTKYLQERILELRHLLMQQGVDANMMQPTMVPIQFTMLPQDNGQTAQAQPQQPVQIYGTQVNYSRPSRLRRLGALPAASLTMQNQRFTAARR